MLILCLVIQRCLRATPLGFYLRVIVNEKPLNLGQTTSIVLSMFKILFLEIVSLKPNLFFNLVIKEKKLFTNCCIQVSHMIWSIVLSNSCFRLVLKLYPGLQHKCIKGTEDVISSDPLFLALYARFTRVPFSPISTMDFRENDIVGLNDILELWRL